MGSPQRLEVVAHDSADLAVRIVEVLAHLAEREQVVKEDIALHLDVDHAPLLLVRELVEIHHDEVLVVRFEPDSLRARGDEHTIARGHDLLVYEFLDLVAQPGCLVHAVEEHHERAHVVRLHEHRAPRFELLAAVHGLDVALKQSLLLSLPRCLFVLAQQIDDALHEDNDRHEPDAITHARAAQQPVGERVHRLLGHPGLAGARPGAHEHRLRRMRAVRAVG